MSQQYDSWSVVVCSRTVPMLQVSMHVYKFAQHGAWPAWNRFNSVHDWCIKSKPGYRIGMAKQQLTYLLTYLSGSRVAHEIVLTTEADNQSSSHCVLMSIVQYTPPTPTRLNCRVASRRRRRCVHEFATSSRLLPMDSVDNLETDQTDSTAVWLREIWSILITFFQQWRH